MTTGFVVIVIGYLAAGIGAVLLYFNTPAEYYVDDSGAMPSNEEVEKTLHRRRVNAHRGFGLLMIGTVLQLAGVIIQWLSTTT